MISKQTCTHTIVPKCKSSDHQDVYTAFSCRSVSHRMNNAIHTVHGKVHRNHLFISVSREGTMV